MRIQVKVNSWLMFRYLAGRTVLQKVTTVSAKQVPKYNTNAQVSVANSSVRMILKHLSISKNREVNIF